MTTIPKTAVIKEKRKMTRLSVPLKIEYALSQSPRQYKEIVVKDISGGGFKFQSEEPLKKKEKLTVKLFFPNRKDPIKILAEIAWCRPLDNAEKNYIEGVKFIKIAPADREKFASIFGELMINYCMSGKTP